MIQTLKLTRIKKMDPASRIFHIIQNLIEIEASKQHSNCVVDLLVIDSFTVEFQGIQITKKELEFLIDTIKMSCDLTGIFFQTVEHFTLSDGKIHGYIILKFSW